MEVWNRHPERAETLVADLAGAAGETALQSAVAPSTASIDLLVNATSVGMRHARMQAPNHGREPNSSRRFPFRPMNWTIG